MDDREIMSTLRCQHTFHHECIDAWLTATLQTPLVSPSCPECRADLQVVRLSTINRTTVEPPTVAQADVENSDGSFNSASEFPWGPGEASVFHTSTQLTDGQLSIIVDPGAWTNLIGADLARKLVQRAMSKGYEPEQHPMTKMVVNGVGQGSQEANYKVVCPIAVPHADGKTYIHQITSPIVEGTGRNLPGLLGLRTLQHERAILDMGRQELIFPGQGEVKFELPPGSMRIPLKKAPSGHLVMVIDDYEKVAERRGGLPHASLQLLSREESGAASADSSAMEQRRVDFPM